MAIERLEIQYRKREEREGDEIDHDYLYFGRVYTA
jgi:hypothetical protein